MPRSVGSRDTPHPPHVSTVSENMANVEATKSLSGLLNGISQTVYHNNREITEELLKNELYPELSQEEFKALHDKMKGLLKVELFGQKHHI